MYNIVFFCSFCFLFIHSVGQTGVCKCTLAAYLNMHAIFFYLHETSGMENSLRPRNRCMNI